MTKKQEFAKRVAGKTGLDNKGAEALVEAVFEVVADVLVEEGKVALGSVGTLKTAERAARNGRNPSTGEDLVIPAKIVAKYKVSKDLDTKINA
jgi:DNA-binding protein HU-beta